MPSYSCGWRVTYTYGAHLSTEEVWALVAPHPDSLELVESWLVHYNISLSSLHWSGGGDWISFHASVAQAELMLGTIISIHEPFLFSNYIDLKALNTTSINIPRHRSMLSVHSIIAFPTCYTGMSMLLLRPRTLELCEVWDQPVFCCPLSKL